MLILFVTLTLLAVEERRALMVKAQCWLERYEGGLRSYSDFDRFGVLSRTDSNTTELGTEKARHILSLYCQNAAALPTPQRPKAPFPCQKETGQCEAKVLQH